MSVSSAGSPSPRRQFGVTPSSATPGSPQYRGGSTASEPNPNFSPIGAVDTTSSPRRSVPQARRPREPLTFDPRSGLPLIDIPRDRQHAFAHLGQNLVLHLFLDVDRISSRGAALRRVLFVTDQSLFLCEESGGVLRCLQVSKIGLVNVAADNSNALALTIPTEYDIILKMDRRQQRDDLLVVLRAVYRRMTENELEVRVVKEIRPNQYRMDKPPGFQLMRIPQRTRTDLARALEAVEMQEQERHEAVEAVQAQLQNVHQNELQTKSVEASAVRAKLTEAETRLRAQQEELENLRQQYAKSRKRVEEIEAQLGPNGEVPTTKDDTIRELSGVVEQLTGAIARVQEEQALLLSRKKLGNFDEVDPEDIGNDAPRYRGRSLQQQGLIEVLQRQLQHKQRELAELREKQKDGQRLQLELARKESQLKELEERVRLAPASDFGGDVNAGGSPAQRSVGGWSGAHVDPTLALDQSAAFTTRNVSYDGDGEAIHKGPLPISRISLPVGTPEYRLPENEKDFDRDPRTNLKFVEIPATLRDAFKDLIPSIVHFVGVGSKFNKRGREQKRVIICSDQTIYQCHPAGQINRCIWITSVREVITEPTAVALLIDGKSEYDAAFRFDSSSAVPEFLSVLTKVNTFLKREPPMKVTRVDRIPIDQIRLEKPPTWEFRLHPLRHRANLFRSLQELAKTSAAERSKLHQETDRHTMEVIQRLKDEMKAEINMRREREFAVLRQQLMLLDASVREKQLEIRNLRRQMSEHKCSVSPQHSSPKATSEENDGMYWIPTDPVVMECDHEILHIQFSDNFVVTSHSNGFLNVWDINTASLFRTLRNNGHTARVQTFCFDGRDLISGGFDSSIRRWNIVEGVCTKVIQGAHRGHVTVVKFDQMQLMSGGDDGVIHVWDISTLRHEKALRGHKSAVTSFSFSRNTLASAEWGWIFVWDIDKGIVVKALRDDNGGITCLDFYGMTIVTGGTGGVLTVWNLHTGEGEQLEGHSDDVFSVQLQQHFCISSGADCSIRMWNVKDMTSLGTFHNSYPHECKKFHFMRNRFVVGEGRTIKVWTR